MIGVLGLPPFLLALAKSSAVTIIQDFLVHACSLVKSNEVSLLLWCALLTSSAFLYVVIIRPRKVFLVDFACYKPDPACICTEELFMDRSTRSGYFRVESLDFQKRILDSFGLGPKTYLPESVLKIPPNLCMDAARKETESVIIGAIDELLMKTKVKVADVRVLVTNCSVFNPTPSLSDMIVNHYKLTHKILCYNLAGMGCSAGLIAIDLAKRLLQVHRNSYALIVSTENTISGLYLGNDRPMLISNCIFRMGGAAILLSNLSSDSCRSKYLLCHTVHTHKASQDNCYNSILQREDEHKITGISVSEELVRFASPETIRPNISTLGKHVLPLTEQLKFIATLYAKKFMKTRVESYTPNFKLAIEHFCIHTGATLVQDILQKVLELSDWHMEPSRMTLYRYGNTSSSSVWYGLAYSEAKGRINKGDRVWQLAFGSGFKCYSAVWCALRTIDPAKETNPWMDEIHEFPVHVRSLFN